MTAGVAPRSHPLVALALRANPKRRLLLVSSVLAKHVPVDPALARLAGTALALAAARDERAPAARAALYAHDASGFAVDAPARFDGPVAVVGFAETATALGHAVADALDADLALQTTRRAVLGEPDVVFDESHSHAPEQLMYLPAGFAESRTVVLVDDELTTGRTATRLVERLRERVPDARFLIAALIDNLTDDDRAALDERGIEVTTLESRPQLDEEPHDNDATREAPERSEGRLPVLADVVLSGDPAPARAGALREERETLRRLGRTVADALETTPDAVVGTGEFMYLPLLTAQAAAAPRCWSTTRSPVRISTKSGYPVTTGIAFAAPEDHERTEYLYNVTDQRRLVLMFETPAERANAVPLLRALGGAGVEHVTCVSFERAS